MTPEEFNARWLAAEPGSTIVYHTGPSLAGCAPSLVLLARRLGTDCGGYVRILGNDATGMARASNRGLGAGILTQKRHPGGVFDYRLQKRRTS